MNTHGNEPEYGQRLPPEDLPARRPPAPQPSISPRAARRMARGLSFTMVMLGVLVGSGLSALGNPWGWVTGALFVLPGIAGFIGVQAQLHPTLRNASEPPPPGRSRLWLIPSALLALGLLPLAGTFAVGPALAGTTRADLVGEYVSVLVVLGMTLVVAAALGFGLVAMASFTPPDDDDSPLRPTGYAERLHGARSGPPGHYDSEWIHRRPPDRYGRARDDGSGPGGAPPGETPGA